MSSQPARTVRTRLSVSCAPQNPDDAVRVEDLEAAVAATGIDPGSPSDPGDGAVSLGDPRADYAAPGAAGLITDNGGSWTASEAGYASAGAEIWTADGAYEALELVVTVNGVDAARTTGFRNVSARHTVEIDAGDVVTLTAHNLVTADNLALAGVQCAFIPVYSDTVTTTGPVSLTADTPAALGPTAKAGGTASMARSDHVHAIPVTASATDLEPGVSALREGHVHFSAEGAALKLYRGNAADVARPVYDSSVAALGLRVRHMALNLPAVPGADTCGDLFFVTEDAVVYSYGRNNAGCLGRPVLPSVHTRFNLGEIPGLSGVVKVVGFDDSTYFLTAVGAGGKVYSCGYNRDGQLGRAVESGQIVYAQYETEYGYSYPSTAVSEVKTNLGEVPGLPPIKDIVAARGCAFFLATDGRVFSCGENGYGKLGRSVPDASPSSSNLGEIAGLPPIAQIVSDGYATYFRTTAGTVYSCGLAYNGRMGYSAPDGDQSATNLGEIPGLTNVTDMAADNGTAYFLTTSGAVYSCGGNDYGKLGRESASSGPYIVQIPGLPAVARVSCYSSSVFFVTAGGTVYSAGRNHEGQLGHDRPDGDEYATNLAEIPGLSGVAEVVPGHDAAYFITGTGQALSCGCNDYGQLGRAIPNARDYGTGAVEPNTGAIPGLTNITQILPMTACAYFRDADGSVYSCGYNSGGAPLCRDTDNGSYSHSNLGEIIVV